MKITTRKIVISAMLIALDVVFTRLLAVNVLAVKMGLGFAAVAVCAMLYGPAWAAVTAAAADLIGALLFPTGAYFPGFTATAAITGVVFGLYLHGARPDFKRCFFAALTNVIVVTLALNTLMIALIFVPFSRELLIARISEAGLMLVLQTAVLSALSASDMLYGKIIEFGGENTQKST